MATLLSVDLYSSLELHAIDLAISIANRLSFGIVLVVIGVQLLGELAIGGLDVLFARVAGHAQDRIGVCHDPCS